MALPLVVGEFRVVADPELRFTPSGKAVGNVRLVANSRKKEGDEWVDDKVVWLTGSIWDREAENMVESIERGMLVNVTGRLETREWEKDGEKRQSTELKIDSISPSLKYATAKVSKVERTSGTTSESKSAPAEDPWAAPATDTPQAEEPPF